MRVYIISAALVTALLLVATASAVEILTRVEGRGFVDIEGAATRISESRWVGEEGANVTVIAIPQEGWEFAYWRSSDQAINGSTSKELRITLVKNVSLVAVFRPIILEPDFVRIRVSSNASVVEIRAPELVLRGREVFISAPETYLHPGREDIRYVFIKWGGELESYQSTLSFVAERDINVTAYYAKEFKFLGEWFSVSVGVPLRVERVELEPGVMADIKCYLISSLNETVCPPEGGEAYVPRKYYGELEPIYDKIVRITIIVSGPGEIQVPVSVKVEEKLESYVASPGAPAELWVPYGSAVTIEFPESLGEDYVLESQGVFLVRAYKPSSALASYGLSPLAPFAKPIRPIASAILSTPLGGLLSSVASYNAVAANAIAASPIAIIVAVSALAFRMASKRLRRLGGVRLAREEVSTVAGSTSPREESYMKSVEEVLMPSELEAARELGLEVEPQQAGSSKASIAIASRNRRRVSLGDALKEAKNGSKLDDAESPWEELSGAKVEELELLARAGLAYVGEPKPAQLLDARAVYREAGGAVAIVGGDGKSYWLTSLGINVIDHWRSRLEEAIAALPKKGIRALAVRWCDPLPRTVVNEMVGLAATSSKPLTLILLYDSPDSEPPKDVAVYRVPEPTKEALAKAAIIESMGGRRIDRSEALAIAERSSRLPGLQYAFARAAGRSEVPLEVLPRITAKLGFAVPEVAAEVASRRIRESEVRLRLINALTAYGEVGLLRYVDYLARVVYSLVEAVGEA